MADIQLDIDLSKFLHAIEEATEIVGDGAKRGLHDVMDEWLSESRNIAPLYVRKGPHDKRPSGTIRTDMHTDILGNGANLTGEIHANAIEVAKKGKWAGKRFNYAWYLHESGKYGESFKHPSTPGTIPKFLDKPAKDNQDKWIKYIEKEIENELKAKGW